MAVYHHTLLSLCMIILMFNVDQTLAYDDDDRCLGAAIVARGDIRKPDGPAVVVWTLFHFNTVSPIVRSSTPFMLHASVLSVGEGPYWSPAPLPQGLSCLSYDKSVTESIFPFKERLLSSLPNTFKLSNNISAIIVQSPDVASATGMPLSRLISELAARDDTTDVRNKYGCQRLLSYTQTQKGVTILAESCSLLSPMCHIHHLNGPTQTCALEHQRRDIANEGAHKQLYATLNASIDAPVRAFEWLPSELFVDPDELYDHSMMGTYPLARVDIEVPSFMNYPLPVITHTYPIPVHTRYTRPDCQKPFEVNRSQLDAHRCQGYYHAWLGSPIWFATSNTTSCAAEKGNVFTELGIAEDSIVNTMYSIIIQPDSQHTKRVVPLSVMPAAPIDLSIPSGNTEIRDVVLWSSACIVVLATIIVINTIIKALSLQSTVKDTKKKEE